MARPKKDGQPFNCYLDRLLYLRLCYYADEKGQTKTVALERILKKYLDEENVPTDIDPLEGKE
jgi:hypothetical protein